MLAHSILDTWAVGQNNRDGRAGTYLISGGKFAQDADKTPEE